MAEAVTHGDAEGDGKETGPQCVRLNGWRQGCVVSSVDIVRLRDAGLLHREVAGHFGLVLTQDCDLVNDSYEAEPEVELLLGNSVSTANPLLLGNRNPRTLHLKVGAAGAEQVYEFRAHERCSVPRPQLEIISPDPALVLTRKDLLMVLDWVTNRYRRPAFPDAFNERRRPATKKLEKLLAKQAAYVEYVLLQLNTQADPPPDNAPYKVTLLVVMRGDYYADEKKHRTVQKQFTIPFAAALDSCAGVEVEEFETLPRRAINLEDLARYQFWDTAEYSS